MQKSEQYPHVEVLSRNRVNRSTIIVAVVPVTIFSLVLVYAIWSFLWLLAYMALAFLSMSILYIVAILAIDVRRRWIAAHVIHLGEYGVVDAQGWRMLPLALPAPVITELSDDEVVKRSKILNLRAKGRSLREIEDELKIPYNQVQKICAAATNLVIEK